MRSRTAVLTILALSMTLLAAACTESARETFAFESAVAPTGLVRVQNLANGAITLRRDPSATRVSGFVNVFARGFDNRSQAVDAVRAVVLVESGDANRLELTVALPPRIDPSRFEVSLDLRVPGRATVAAVGDRAPIYIEDLTVGPVDNRDGRVELRRTFGDVSVRTSNGDVVITTHDGPLDVRTNNGVVDIVDVLGSVRASTTNAFARVEAVPPIGGEVFVSTTNAPVEVGVDFDFGALVTASTTPDFLVEIDRALDFFIDYSEPGYVEGQLFDGRGTLDVRTTFGPITLYRL